MYIASVFIRSSLLKTHSDMRDMPAPGSAMISSNRSVACVFRRNIPSLESPTITRFILIALVDYPVSLFDYISSLAVFYKPITYPCQDFTSCVQSHERVLIVHSICVHRTTTPVRVEGGLDQGGLGESQSVFQARRSFMRISLSLLPPRPLP